MDSKSADEIGSIIHSFKHSLQSHLPALEKAVKDLINERRSDTKTIEQYLDTLLSLTALGFGDKLFVQLLDYYKTIDEDGAMFYWKEYDKENEDF